MTLRRVALTVGSVIALVGGGIAAYKWSQSRTRNFAPKPVTSSRGEWSSVPPFSTKEPERYQATRVVTIVEPRDGATTATLESRSFIARDGDKRREEYESGTSSETIYLETLTGHFILIPAKKLYADLSAVTPDSGALEPQADFAFSPERLLNETSAYARYEKLGPEALAGRTTTKYRVVPIDAASGTEAMTETLIWIDDTLGMAIRSETSSSAAHPSKVTVELRDIKLSVGSELFELPRDFKKVGYLELRGK